jgi:hypothetical protein
MYVQIFPRLFSFKELILIFEKELITLEKEILWCN